MKKTIAAGGASLLGLSAVGLGAAPAMAAGEPPCTDITEHELRATGSVADWYMACIPQYAVSSVNFVITSETPFPAGFQTLDSPGVTSVASVGAAGTDYVGSTPPPAGFEYLSFDSGDATSQYYNGNLIFPITVSSIATSALPADCQFGGASYTNAYVVNYAPTSVVFTQTVDGAEWRYDVVVAPGPLYLGLSIDPSTPPTWSGGSMCGSANGETSTDNYTVEEWATVVDTRGESLMPYFGDGKSLPDIARYVPPAPAEPTLPPTGVDIAAPLGLAATFLALGVAGGYLRRRRADA